MQQRGEYAGAVGDTLLACARRASRLGWGGPGRWRAAILSPSPTPHRRKVASALLKREAEENGGRLFTMASGDEVLLCPGPAEALRTNLAALHPGEQAPVVWLTLPEQSDELLEYARTRTEAALPARPLRAGLSRNMAVLAGERGLRPVFQSVSPAGKGARLEISDLVDVLPRLAAWTNLNAAPVLQLSMSLTAVLSPNFERFVLAANRMGLEGRLGVTVPLLAALADPDGWQEAAAIVRGHGAALALDGIAHATLTLVAPAALGPDLVKVTWSTEMIEGGPGLLAALRAIGAERIVLENADTEIAVRWGLSRGIRRFQGRHVDVMLAGVRMAACLEATACTVRQCADRAAATNPAGRAGCRNPAHLSDAPRAPAA